MKQKHSLLVVDDEPGIVESVRYLLRRDYDVYTATSADEALDVLAESEIHIVMTDQRMPYMTGVDLLKKIKGKYPDAIRILFTGFADLDAVIEAINQGNVFRYLAKPWDPDELIEAVGAAAGEYEKIVMDKELLSALKESTLAFGSRATLSPALISALSDVLERVCVACRPGGDGRGEVRRCVHTIAAESDRLGELVSSMLNLLMQDEIPASAPPENFPLSKVVDSLLDELSPIFASRRIELRTEGDFSNEVRHNPDLVRSVLFSVISNAVRFSPDGTTIELQAAREDGTVIIQVSDRGGGIPQADLPHVFEPFFTSQEESRPLSVSWRFGGRGVGLGLAIAKKLAEAHGGGIAIENRPGGGTTATIRLEAAPEAAEIAAGNEEQQSSKVGR